MSSVNKVILVGRLGDNPQVFQFQNGSRVTNVSLATSERWTDKNTGERRESTEWHRVSFYGKLGEIAAQYLQKGSTVYVEGSLHTKRYTDKQNIERYATEIRASEMRMLSSPYQNAYQPNQQHPGNNGNNSRRQTRSPHQNNMQPSPMTSMQRPPQGQSGNGYAVNPATGVADDDIPF